MIDWTRIDAICNVEATGVTKSELWRHLRCLARKGKWIYGTDPETGEKDIYPWTCSLCNEKYPWLPRFCPNCGARMMNFKERMKPYE